MNVLENPEVDPTKSVSAGKEFDPAQLASSASGQEPIAEVSDSVTVRVGSGQRFTIGSIMLLVGLIAFGLGLYRVDPSLGGMFGLFVPPALVSMVLTARRRTISGQPVSFFLKAWFFVRALLTLLTIALAGFIAFCVTCVFTYFNPQQFGNSYGPFVFSVVAALVGIAFAYGRFHKSLWKRQ